MFVDLKAAFDLVDRGKLMEVMGERDKPFRIKKKSGGDTKGDEMQDKDKKGIRGVFLDRKRSKAGMSIESNAV